MGTSHILVSQASKSCSKLGWRHHTVYNSEKLSCNNGALDPAQASVGFREDTQVCSCGGAWMDVSVAVVCVPIYL